MACVWNIKDQDAVSVLFGCDVCQREIRFVREGYGEPHTDGVSPPDNVLEYLGGDTQCNQP